MIIRNEIVSSVRVAPHHVLSQFGLISYWTKGQEDVTAVIELFKMRQEFFP